MFNRRAATDNDMRVAFSHALTGGQAVTEFEPEGKAATEIRQLWDWLCRNVSR